MKVELVRAYRLVGLVIVGGLLVGGGSAFGAGSPATAAASNVFPVVAGSTAPVGDIAVSEAAVGQLPVGDVVTYRFADSASGATLHFSSTPTVGGSNGLAATVAVASSSGTLNDEARVTITASSSGAFPGVLTLSGLNATVDSGAATGADIVSVSDTAGVIASSGSPVTVTDANQIGSAAKASFSAVSQPTIVSTGSSQTGGSLTLTEPAKLFFKTGDVITFSIRDALGSTNTVGLDATPTASAGGMSVSVTGLSGGAVQQNDTGFKLAVTTQDASNGSASTIQISNLVFNTAQAPLGPVTISAVVSTGAGTEYIYPGRVTVATVGGNTQTTAAGAPLISIGGSDQPAANVAIRAAAGSLNTNDTFSLTIQEPGVTFTSAPVATVTSGGMTLTNDTSTLDATKTIATWTVSGGSLTATTLAIGPIAYDIAASGPSPGDLVNVAASGSASSAFTSQTVADAQIAPSSHTTFAAVTPTTTTPGSASDITYQEASGMQATAGGAIVLLSPYATQIAAYRTTFASPPTATVTPGSGLVLGTGSVNTSAITVVTANGAITAPPQTAAIFPITTGSTTLATVTFSGLSYTLGNYVPPGTLVATGTLNSGSTTGGGNNVAGNQFVAAVNLHGLGGDTTPPSATLAAPSTIGGAATIGFSEDVTNATTADITLDVQGTTTPVAATLSCTTSTGTAASCSAGPFRSLKLQPASPLIPGQHYTLTVNPAGTASPLTDMAGNVAAQTSLAFRASTSEQETSLAASYAWQTVASSSAYGGSYTTDHSAGASARYTFTGTTVTWYTVTGKSQGEASVSIDGTSKGTVNNYASTTHYKVARTYSGLAAGTHTLTIKVLGKKGSTSATDTRVAIDAFGTSSVDQTPAATYTWKHVATSKASGGGYASSDLKGSRVTFTFRGTAITWYTIMSPSQGQASVAIDGISKGTVDNYASTTKYGAKRTYTGLTDTVHTITITVLGTKRSTSTGTAIAVDHFTIT